MMEPGEAEALLDIDRRATRLLVEAGRTELADAPAPTLQEFARFCLAHEVFVASDHASGLPVGFAAARNLVELYWLSAIAVAPEHGRQGIGRALLACVVERAGWFFHRAVGLSTYAGVPFNAPYYERSGFMKVATRDLDAVLAGRLAAECPPGADLSDRTVMVKWL